MTLIQAIDVLRSRGYYVAADPRPDLPGAVFDLQGHGVAYVNLTGATLRSYAAYGVPSRSAG